MMAGTPRYVCCVYRSLSACTCLHWRSCNNCVFLSTTVSLVANSSVQIMSLLVSAHEQSHLYRRHRHHRLSWGHLRQCIPARSSYILGKTIFLFIALLRISFHIRFNSWISLMTITRQFFTVSIQFRLIDVTVSLSYVTFFERRYINSIHCHSFRPLNCDRFLCSRTCSKCTHHTLSLSTHNFSWSIIYFPRAAIVLTTLRRQLTHTHSISTLNESMNERTNNFVARAHAHTHFTKNGIK